MTLQEAAAAEMADAAAGGDYRGGAIARELADRRQQKVEMKRAVAGE